MLAVDGSEVLIVSEHVKVTHVPAAEDEKDSGYGVAVLEWDASPLADCVADAVVSVLLQEQGKPAAVGAAEEERKCGLLVIDAVLCCAEFTCMICHLIKHRARLAAEASEGGLVEAVLCCDMLGLHMAAAIPPTGWLAAPACA